MVRKWSYGAPLNGVINGFTGVTVYRTPITGVITILLAGRGPLRCLLHQQKSGDQKRRYQNLYHLDVQLEVEIPVCIRSLNFES